MSTSWFTFERELRHLTRKLGPLVLKEPKSKETPNIRPLTFRVADVSHVGTGKDNKGRLTLHGVVNVRDYGSSMYPKVSLVQKNAAKIRSMVKPAADVQADSERRDAEARRLNEAMFAVAAIRAEFEAELVDA